MKKRCASAMLFLTIITMCCACSSDNKLITGTYNNTENTEYGNASIVLSDDNEFIFCFQGISYSAVGKYAIEGDSLTLAVNDEEVYIFTLDNGKLIFESGEWAEKRLDKGAVFQLSNE